MSEKMLKLVENENKLVFEVSRKAGKNEIKKEIEKMFNVKVINMNTHIRFNKKIAFVQLDKKNPAIDVATKLGLI